MKTDLNRGNKLKKKEIMRQKMLKLGQILTDILEAKKDSQNKRREFLILKRSGGILKNKMQKKLNSNKN